MLVHEPDGTTIGIPGCTDLRNRRASPIASARSPSLKATWPQQNARRTGITLTRKRSSTVAAASITCGKNSSARQVENSWTSFIARPHHDRVQRLGTMHSQHDSLFDVGGATGSRDQGQAMLDQARGTEHREHRGEI